MPDNPPNLQNVPYRGYHFCSACGFANDAHTGAVAGQVCFCGRCGHGLIVCGLTGLLRDLTKAEIVRIEARGHLPGLMQHQDAYCNSLGWWG